MESRSLGGTPARGIGENLWASDFLKRVFLQVEGLVLSRHARIADEHMESARKLIAFFNSKTLIVELSFEMPRGSAGERTVIVKVEMFQKRPFSEHKGIPVHGCEP